MAAPTRIGERHLEALESERSARPAGAGLRQGFIRAYCGSWATPGRGAGPLRSPASAAPLPRPSAPAGPHVRPAKPIGRPPSRDRQRAPADLGRRPRSTEASASQPHAGTQSARAARAGGRAPDVALPETAPPAAPASTAAAPPARWRSVAQPAPPPTRPSPGPARPSPQRLIVRAVEPTWIRVQIDDGRVAEELLAAGAQREWTADSASS